ncbi:sensor histidine kinase [Gillisia limnaea]|uniref:Putative signal transduction histidine kinase n=1 Tax=Gillisia limnaea (strain DSM 15749 / LMG 21470 / R-8282) TaxID=865937 RepID=H2BXK3_GILLR|nr:histidine kinase [Gillisia limnaea]EHQ03127.1 putative signal transduction histidine kinase [Gillisia limnaea DSM 15749]
MKPFTHTGSMTKKKEVLFHGLFWFLFAYFELIQFELSNPYFFKIRKLDIFEISAGIIFLATFYFTYILILPRVFEKLNWKRVFFGIGSGYIFFISLRYILEEILINHFMGHGNYFEGTSFTFYTYDNLYYGSFPLIVSSILWILIFNIRLLEYNKHIIEEKSATEVKFLKAQLNPHFMFNTLNNIYSLVYFKSDKALSAIEKLGELMRYTTYETNKERIDLQQEVNYIKSYIELDQLRHEDGNTVNFQIDIENPSVQIPPFLLSPLVENALKHGKYNKDNPILFNLKQTGNTLFFKITNKIGNQKKDKLGGIGLDNLKKSLAINYPDAHSIKINKEQQTFSVQLEIKLDEKLY